MNSPIIFPWGPLLVKQMVDLSVTNEFLKDFNYNNSNIELPFPSLEKRKEYDVSNVKYINLLSPYIKNYLKIRGLENNFKLNILWGNLYGVNHYIPPHTHGNCDLSFVLFLEMPPTHLLNLEKGEGFLTFGYGEKSDWRSLIKNITYHRILPKINELYIFPHNLRHHSTPMSNPHSKRISVTGNIELL